MIRWFDNIRAMTKTTKTVNTTRDTDFVQTKEVHGLPD